MIQVRLYGIRWIYGYGCSGVYSLASQRPEGGRGNASARCGLVSRRYAEQCVFPPWVGAEHQ